MDLSANNQNYSESDYQHRLAAATYFRERSGFNRLFILMRKKYISLSRIGGVVKLNNPTTLEHEELSRYFSKMYGKNAPIQISLKTFEDVLKQSKFQNIGLKELLEFYFIEKIETKEMKIDRLAIQEEKFFQTYLKKYQEKHARLWIRGIRDGEISGSHQLHRLLVKEQVDKAGNWIDFTLTVIELLLEQLNRKTYKRLPFFAQEVTHDPHGLDRNNANYTVFLLVMQWLATQVIVEEIEGDRVVGTTLETTNELLNQFYLYKDDIANFVSIYGFEGSQNGEQVEWLTKAAEDNSAINLPLREVNRLDKALSYKNQPVVLIENSGVYSQLLSRFNHGISFICIHGQPNLATLKFIDLIYANKDILLYYAGDFDPEGLVIAQNLLNRYSGLQTIWQKYSLWYKKGSTSLLNELRLNKLRNVNHPQLAEARKLLEKNRVPFYQEQFMFLFEQLVEEKMMKNKSILE